MIDDFRIELTKLLGLLAAALVVVIGLLTGVPLLAILIRAAIGGVVFAAIGFLAGHVIEQQRAVIEKTEQITAEDNPPINTQNLKNAYGTENVEHKQDNIEAESEFDEFSPLDIQNLSKIIVDSLNE